MARGVNKVILIGNLGADPEKGNNYTKANLAIADNYKDKKTGETVEKTEWIKVVFFGRLAEIAAQYLAKGSKVYIEGAMQTSTFEKDGQTHYSTSVVASSMQMLDSKGEGASKAPYQAPSKPKSSTWSTMSGPEAAKTYAEFDDSLPF